MKQCYGGWELLEVTRDLEDVSMYFGQGTVLILNDQLQYVDGEDV